MLPMAWAMLPKPPRETLELWAIEDELLLAQKLDTQNAGQGGDARLVAGAHEAAVAAGVGAHVDVGRQDADQPSIERLAERRHHDRHCHQET